MLTGLVVDSGDGVTHVVPVADGYLIGTDLVFLYFECLAPSPFQAVASNIFPYRAVTSLTSFNRSYVKESQPFHLSNHSKRPKRSKYLHPVRILPAHTRLPLLGTLLLRLS